MKKFLLLSLSLLVVALFCGAAFAQVGHVGHVKTDQYQSVDPADIIFDPATISSTAITLAPALTGDDINMQGDGTYDVIILGGIDADFVGPYSGEMTINVSATGLNPDGILILNNSGKYDYYPLVGGVATIPNIEDYLEELNGSGFGPSAAAHTTKVFLVNAEKETTPTGGGGGGGCSLGMLSPFALLLAVPLVLLKK